MEFVVQSELDFPQFLALNRLAGKTYRRWWTRIFRGVGFVMGGCMLLINALMLRDSGYISGMGLGFFIGVSLLAAAAFYHYFNAWGSSRQMLKAGRASTVTMNETGLTEVTEIATVQYVYNAFFELVDYRTYYFLFLDQKHAYILPKSAFIQGNAADFPQFIEKKCEKQMKHIK